MIRIRAFLATLASALQLGACSTHPLPEDVTAVPSEGIVAIFRCEMREAVRHRILNAVRRRPVDAHLADALQRGELSYRDLRKSVRDPGLLAVLNRYAGATILFDFSLTMTEKNDISGTATLTRPFTRGTDTIGFALVDNHQRQNIRTHTSRDTFEGVLVYVDDVYCKDRPTVPNFDYPIAGRPSRLDEMVTTFLNLNQSGNLVGKEKLDTPTMADDLQFTTKKMAGITPGFTYSPMGRIFELAGASGSLSASREDLHRVTIVLALPPPGSKPTPLTLAETDQLARDRLALAQQNRTYVTIEKIGNSLSDFGFFR
ncbi:hypothetical protein [Methylobacterium brachiatum]|uniref:hypothetical protein n=1 Tax=Methylobacterium brachiatum TaxID=269660 RepID=UPI0008F03E7B|nr:hypothetical protein [Methylobacterium brachiatum]SFJ38522.1 hypothetical protein SAMN02799642_04248 [Methylobacterium brachiatum]